MEKLFGQYIKELRTEKGLTLTQLAESLEMDSANLSKVENGKRDFDK
jgi:transcriptional regulator with XRE-family HTH domain